MFNMVIKGTVKVKKLYDEIELPQYKTQGSACFDLSACLLEEKIDVYDAINKKTFERVFTDGNDRFLHIYPRNRVMVPTGLIFDLPSGFSMRIHPRSGTSYKQGLCLVNSEGVVDNDFVLETKILLTNTSRERVTICHGERIAQAEIVPMYVANFIETTDEIAKKTDRVDGFGSTGK